MAAAGRRRSPTAPSAATQTGRRDLHLCTGPLYHAAPLAFSLAAPLSSGAARSSHGALGRRGGAPARSRPHRITHTHMVPTMFLQLLSLPEDVRERYDVSSLRHVLHGAAPCPVHVKQAAHRVARARSSTSTTRPPRAPAPSSTRPPGCRSPAPWAGRSPEDQVKIGDERGQRAARRRGRPRLPEGPRRPAFEYFKDTEKTAATYRGDYFTLATSATWTTTGFSS